MSTYCGQIVETKNDFIFSKEENKSLQSFYDRLTDSTFFNIKENLKSSFVSPENAKVYFQNVKQAAFKEIEFVEYFEKSSKAFYAELTQFQQQLQELTKQGKTVPLTQAEQELKKKQDKIETKFQAMHDKITAQKKKELAKLPPLKQNNIPLSQRIDIMEKKLRDFETKITNQTKTLSDSNV